jgi:iron complex transport system permease protein
MNASRSASVIIATLLAAVLIGFLGLLIGAKAMSLSAALSALFAPGQGLDSVIIWTLRMPRSIAAFLAGSGLAVTGYLLQSITRNPLAAPDLTGVTAGAVVVIIFCFVFMPTLSSVFYPFIGLAGGLAAAAATFWVARGGEASPLHLALGGITISLFLGGLTTYILLLGGPQSPAVLFWLSGGLQGRSWSALAFMVPWVLIGIAGALAGHRALELLSLGDDAAQGMGLKLRFWKPLFLILAVCPVAGITPVAGPIAFVGLAVPHIVRLLGPQSAVGAILLNASIGGFMLVTADMLARSIAAPRELPVSIILALIGGPFFIHLVQRRTLMSGVRA